MCSKIGIMGGTFDPVHIGHLIIAQTAKDEFELDKVLFMPTGIPPHKRDRKVSEAMDRCNMVELAIESNSDFELSTIEVNRAGYTYTYETLLELKRADSDVEYFFILGADSLFDFEKWRNIEIIFSNATILAASRRSDDKKTVDDQIEYLRKKYDARIEKLDCPDIDVSSNMIRDYVRHKKSIKYYVSDAVEQYIYEHKLYNGPL